MEKSMKFSGLFLAMLLASYCSVASASNTTVSFYAKDQKGSTAGLTDGNGNLTATALNQYNDYGVNQTSSNASGQIGISYDPYQYSGEYTDQESGLQPLGNGYRYYDPSLMRFTSPDSYPLLNLYAYGSGNPVMEMDPTGHLSMSWQAGVGMGVAGVTGIIGGFFTAGISEFVGLAVTEALLGSASSAIGDGATYLAGGKMSWAQAGLDMGVGAAAGVAGAVIGKALDFGVDAIQSAGRSVEDQSSRAFQLTEEDQDYYQNGSYSADRRAFAKHFQQEGSLYKGTSVQSLEPNMDFANRIRDNAGAINEDGTLNKKFIALKSQEYNQIQTEIQKTIKDPEMLQSMKDDQVAKMKQWKNDWLATKDSYLNDIRAFKQSIGYDGPTIYFPHENSSEFDEHPAMIRAWKLTQQPSL